MRFFGRGAGGLPLRRRRDLGGRVDRFENRVVLGWAHDGRASQQRVLVDVFADGAFAGQALANLYREDLARNGVGDGCHAFQLDLKATPHEAARWIEVRFAATGRLLPSALPVREAAAPPSAPGSIDEYLTRLFSGWFATQTPEAAAAPYTPADGLAARLFDRVEGEQGWGRRPSRYLESIRQRRGGADLFEPGISRAQYAAFLTWYLEDYGQVRGRLRAPLGAEEIAFLTQAGAAGEPSFVRRAFAGRFAPGVDENGQPIDADFQWRAYDSAVLALEDCLPDDNEADRLRAVAGAAKPWPLSDFMRAFFAVHPVLAAMPLARAEDRARAYCVFGLFAATAPHLLRYAPPDLWNFMAPDLAGESPFEQACAAMFGVRDAGPCWRAQVARRQFDPDRHTFATRLPGGARASGPGSPRAGGPAVDVQLIGPFSRALGVGESCRRLARALRRLDLSLRLCDFALDHPNAEAATQEFGLTTPGATRVNILHLNLEDTPTALAYAPDVFTGARNIVFPYLETTPISWSQRFGLSLAHEAFAATRFVADAISPFAPAQVVGGAIADPVLRGKGAAREKAYGGLAGVDDFVFLTAGDALSGGWRKNPLGVARAFKTAFPTDPDVRLVIKTHSIDRVALAGERRIWTMIEEICREDPRVVLIDALLDNEAHSCLSEGADCLVSLHRAEGLGYHLLEAMALGAPVIASDYSGTRDFCTQDTAFLTSGRIVPVEPGHYPRAGAEQVWFEPDIEVAAMQMQRVREDRVRREAVAEAGRCFVLANYSYDAFAGRLKKALASALA